MDNRVVQKMLEPSSCSCVPSPSTSRCQSEESFCSSSGNICPSKVKCSSSSSAVDIPPSICPQCESKAPSSARDLEVSEKETKKFNSSFSKHATSTSSRQPALKPAPHHQQEALCVTRPRYRQGRRLTAVKVYTVADESVYLLINGVPSISLVKELKKLCLKRGKLLELKTLSEYPKEAFTDVFLVKYECLRQARLAKKFLDGRNFFGGLLHVCYAPELETVEETRKKLLERRLTVSQALTKNEENSQGSILAQYHPQDKLTASVRRISRRLKCNDDILQLSSSQLSAEKFANLKRKEAGASRVGDADAAVTNWEHQEHSSESVSVEHLESLQSSRCRVSENETDLSQAGPGLSLFPNKRLKSDHCALSCSSSVEKVSLKDQLASEFHCKNSGESFDRNSSSEAKAHDYQNFLSGPGLGHVYASMDADHEPGIGRISGEHYSYPGARSDFKNVEGDSSSIPRTKRKGWMEISNEMKKKKRKAQPRLSRLETKEPDGYYKTLEGGNEYDNRPHLSAAVSRVIHSNTFRDANLTQTKQAHLPDSELVYVHSKTTAMVSRVEDVKSTAKSEVDISLQSNIDRKQEKSTSTRRGKVHTTGRPTHLHCSNSSNGRKIEFLDAIRAAASVSFGPVSAGEVRKVSQRPTPKMSLKEGVKLV